MTSKKRTDRYKQDLQPQNSLTIRDAISTYFNYESTLAKSKLRKRHRTARLFALIGLIVLVVCLSIAQVIDSIESAPRITNIASVSFIIIGWVAMWPIREQRQYFDKIALLQVEVVGNGVHA